MPYGIRNTKGRVCLNAHNKDWLKELAKEIPEAKWEIQNIHNHPYQIALGSGQHSNKFNKLPNTYQTTVTPFKHTRIFSINHKLGNAKTEANYHAYYQTLIKDGTANGATSNAYLTSSDVPFKTKCTIMK